MDITTSSPAREHYDVVIVGARVAGASTALLLARAGHRVAVLDRVRFPSDTLSTHLIWPTGVVQLQRLGLLDEVVSAGTPLLRSIHNDIDGLALEIPVWPESGVDAVVAPRRTLLDTVILRAAERAGAQVIEGVTVDGVSRDRTGRVSGVVGHAGGNPVQVTADVVVGADGWRSRIAREVGAPAYDEKPPVNAVHYAYFSDLEDRGVELWYRTSGLMAGIFPTNDGACVYVNCRPERVAELRDDLPRGFAAMAAEVAPDLAARLGAATRTSAVRGTPGLPGFLRQPWGPGWVLVGDAGCTKDPASAHGISSALRDAELAAVAIDAALRDPAVGDDAMRTFHATRDRSRPLYDLAWAMASYDWDAEALLGLELQYGAELVREAQETAALPGWAGVPEPDAALVPLRA